MQIRMSATVVELCSVLFVHITPMSNNNPCSLVDIDAAKMKQH